MQLFLCTRLADLQPSGKVQLRLTFAFLPHRQRSWADIVETQIVYWRVNIHRCKDFLTE